jgi:hypothetical protein
MAGWRMPAATPIRATGASTSRCRSHDTWHGIVPAERFQPTPTYRPRDPRRTPLYRLFVEHFETLLSVWDDRFKQRYGFLPSQIERLVDGYLRCGLHGAGFARVVCPDCKHEYLVAFSCKARFLCPSCHQRKALVWSEWVADEVVEDVSHRMWVLTIPKRVRRFFLYDRSLLGELSRIGARVVQAFYRDSLGRDDVKPGIVSVIHTSNSDLEWNPHLHLLVSEGAFDGEGEFIPLSVDHPTQLAQIEQAFRREILALLVARDLLDEDDVEGMLAWPHSGFRVDTRVHLSPGDREGVQDIAKYLAHGPVALSRLSYRKGGGQVRLQLRRSDWRTGKREVVFEPLEFLARFLQHLPATNQKMWRQYGAYSTVVRAARRRAAEHEAGSTTTAAVGERSDRKPCSRTWAALLSRVYGYEPLVCPRCGGEMQVLATLHDPSSIRRILDHLDIDGRVPPLQPSRAPPPGEQEEFGFTDHQPDVDDLLTDPGWPDEVPVVEAG